MIGPKLLLLLCATKLLFASSIDINPSIGMNYAWYDEYPILVPNFGFDIPVSFNNHEFRSGLHYSPKGHKYNRDYFYAYWLHYLEVPFAYSYYPIVFKKRVGLFIGYSISYLMSISIEEENGFETYSSTNLMFNNIDHGGIIGLRYNQIIREFKFDISLNYYQGIATVREF